MRKPKVPAPNLRGVAPSGLVLADIELSVGTPMFGGGVVAGMPDDVHPIRATSIRGHLRFWWRAWNAAVFATREELHQAERQIWGSAANVKDPHGGDSAIVVKVMDVHAGTEYRPRVGGAIGYAVFPFKQTPGNPEKPGRQGVRFRLQISLSPYKEVDRQRCIEAITDALRAWIIFGGVGARTRRGCGALLCTGDAQGVAADVPIKADQLRVSGDPSTWLKGLLKLVPAKTTDTLPLKGIPALHKGRYAIHQNCTDAMAAWRIAVDSLYTYTQGEDTGRFGHQRHSLWPDVSAARRIAGLTSGYEVLGAGYNPDLHLLRANLGLPKAITMVPRNATSGMTIERAEVGFSRMPSPIILKPWLLPDGTAVPLIALLRAPHIWDARDGQTRPRLKLKWSFVHNGVQEGTATAIPAPYDKNQPALYQWPFGDQDLPNRPPYADSYGSVRDSFFTFATNKLEGWEAL